MSNTSTNKVFSNLIWRFCERFGAQIVTLIVSIVLARLLDPVAYGTIAIVTVIITFLQVFVDSGLGNALIQKTDSDDLDFSTVFYFNFCVCIVLYVALFFFAPVIADFYDNDLLTPIIRVLGVALIISGIKNVQQAYVSKHLLFKRFFFSTIGGTIAAAVIGIVMAYFGYGVWALVAQFLSNLAIDTLILWITVHWRPKLMFSFQRLKRLFKYGWKLLVAASVDALYTDINKLIIGGMYAEDKLAFYDQGEKYPRYAVTNINAAIDSVLLPTMSKEQENRERVRAMTRRAIKTGSYVMWPLMVGLGVCAEAFVKVLLTDKWLDSVPFLWIFCFVYAFYPIHTANLNAIKALGRSDTFLVLEIIKKVVGIALLLATLWFGPLAIAGGMALGVIVSSVLNAFPNKKLLGYSYFEQVKDILPAVIMSVIMGAIVYCVNFIGLSAMATLLIQVPLGVCIYVLISFLTKNESFCYILDTLKRFFAKKEKNATEVQGEETAEIAAEGSGKEENAETTETTETTETAKTMRDENFNRTEENEDENFTEGKSH